MAAARPSGLAAAVKEDDMRRHLFWLLALLAVSCAPYDTVGSNTYFGFRLDISSAPPPPRVVVVGEPAYVEVPGTTVYIVQNSSYDVFRYGSFFYVSSGGYWYRAN